MTYGFLVFALLLTSVAPAPQDSGAQRHTLQVHERFEEVKQRLALTPEQVEQVRPVLEEEAGKLKALRARYTGGNQSRRAKVALARELRDIQTAADGRLRKILSSEQMDELKKIREERRAQLRERRRG